MGTSFSEDRLKRYILTRGLPPHVCFVMLNPSRADEETDDPTVRKCLRFAKRWGYGGIVVVNLIPVIATDPYSLPLWRGRYQDNASYIRKALETPTIVLAWGSVPTAVRRGVALQEHILHFREIAGERPLFCIGLTKRGDPRHPSRARYTESPEPWYWDKRGDSDHTILQLGAELATTLQHNGRDDEDGYA